MPKFLRRTPWLSENEKFAFPSPETASEEGIVCVGGNLSLGLILSAYEQGIFPWFSDGEPLLWWSPDPRFVVLPETLHISASARRLLNRREFEIAINRDFGQVIRRCATTPRKGQDGTWITEAMIDAYSELHAKGYAHSIEAWKGDELAGGLYGIAMGKAFFGESMFSTESGASKTAFLTFAQTLFKRGFEFIDSQVYTDYVAGMGGVELPRSVYLEKLHHALGSVRTPIGPGIEFFDFIA